MASEVDEGCICYGNWRQIVKEVDHLIGQDFKDGKGETWKFFGVVHADDDYYYGMHRAGKLNLLSCVVDLQAHGFEPVGNH